MSGVVATGLVGEVCLGLRAALANSLTFQQINKFSDANTALSRIFQHGAAAGQARPFAVVGLDDMSRQQESGGLQTSYNPSGKLHLTLEVDTVLVGGVVTTGTNRTAFSSNTLAGLPDNYLKGLLVEFLTGLNTGLTCEIAANFSSSGNVTLLGAGIANTPQPGDTFKIYGLTQQDVLVWFSNTLSAIISDLEAVSGTSGYPNFTAIRLTEDWGRVKSDDGLDDYCGAKIAVEYGL